jgi:hypothetical protein
MYQTFLNFYSNNQCTSWDWNRTKTIFQKFPKALPWIFLHLAYDVSNPHPFIHMNGNHRSTNPNFKKVSFVKSRIAKTFLCVVQWILKRCGTSFFVHMIKPYLTSIIDDILLMAITISYDFFQHMFWIKLHIDSYISSHVPLSRGMSSTNFETIRHLLTLDR